MKRERPSVACVNRNVYGRTVASFGAAASSLDIGHSTRNHDECSVVHKRIRALPGASMTSYPKPASMTTYGCHPSACGPVSGGMDERSSKTSITPSSLPLQYYGFFSTTAFDRSILPPKETIMLATEMAADLYGEAKVLLDTLSDVRAANDEAKAIDALMCRIDSFFGDESRSSATDNANAVKGVFRALVRVYVYCFQRYYRTFEELEVAEYLNASWQRLLSFAAEYRVLEEEFIRKVLNFVNGLTGVVNIRG